MLGLMTSDQQAYRLQYMTVTITAVNASIDLSTRLERELTSTLRRDRGVPSILIRVVINELTVFARFSYAIMNKVVIEI